MNNTDSRKKLNVATFPHDQFTNLIISANRELKGRCIRSALDLIILTAARSRSICGYDIIGSIYQEFKILMSPGTVYPVLDDLERKGFLRSQEDGRRRTYTLTRTGTIIVSELTAEYSQVESQLLTICNRKE